VCMWIIVGLFGFIGAGHFAASESDSDIVRWPSLLGFAAFGVFASFHGLRILPAMRLKFVSSSAIMRYLALHS
jgi:hypothetical protein